jgi:predicted RNase H-like HicB family nuclease
MDLELYMVLPYAVQVRPDECSDGTVCYVAQVMELDGCESHGDTPEEALENLQEAKRLFIGSMLEDGLNPPLPAAVSAGVSVAQTTVWTVDSGDYQPIPDQPVLVSGELHDSRRRVDAPC